MRPSLPGLLVSAALLTGCATVGPDYLGAPDMPAVTADLPSSDLDQEDTIKRAQTPQQWWKLLNDEQLDELIERAMEANTDLRIAAANLRAARTVLVETRTGLEPRVDLDASIQRQRESSAILGQPDDKLDDITASGASLGLAWELDVFGRVQRSIEAAEADVGQVEALRDDVMRIVVAELASSYIDLRGAQQRQQVILRNIENQQETLELTRVLAKEGVSTELDVARAQAQLLATEATLPGVLSDQRVAINRLARLTGRGPGELGAELEKRQPMPALLESLPVGEVSDLIRQRPDIRVAERELASASARVGIATADLFPRVSFNASVGLLADSMGDLGSEGAGIFSIGPAITWNLLNREAIHARIAQAEAGAEARLANYEGVVLSALEEIDSALAQHLFERRRHASLYQSLAASSKAARLARIRYTEGVESFLNVLDAERTLLNAEEQLTASDIQLAQSLVSIYRALGGGWQNG